LAFFLDCPDPMARLNSVDGLNVSSMCGIFWLLLTN
jgi:hypothetical protein